MGVARILFIFSAVNSDYGAGKVILVKRRTCSGVTAPRLALVSTELWTHRWLHACLKRRCYFRSIIGVTNSEVPHPVCRGIRVSL